MYSAHNSNTYLAYFNQIDKYLSYVLKLQKYVPYHERVTMITRGKYSISHFVSRFEAKLRYFGDLRNQLVHGFRLDNKHFLIVSDHALEQISSIHDELTKPKTLGDIFDQKVILAEQLDSLESIMTLMSKRKLKYLPVYNQKKFVGILSFQDMLSWLATSKKIDVAKTNLADVDVTSFVEYKLVPSSTNIYEVQDIFGESQDIEVVISTKSGQIDGEIQGLISVYDIAHLQEKYLRLRENT